MTRVRTLVPTVEDGAMVRSVPGGNVSADRDVQSMVWRRVIPIGGRAGLRCAACTAAARMTVMEHVVIALDDDHERAV